MLAVPLCGPRVVARLEQIGIQRLDELADRDPLELILAVNLSAGRPIWHPPMAERAMTNLIAAAQAQCQAGGRRRGAFTPASRRGAAA